MTLKDLIVDLINARHRGRENAIRRRKLLLYCRQFDPELTDRELRRIVEDLPQICTGSKGYFMPESYEEVEDTVEYLRKKALAMLRRAKKIRLYYRALSDSGQMRLFI